MSIRPMDNHLDNHLRITALSVLLIILSFSQMSFAAAYELNMQVASPETSLDTLKQGINLTADVGDGWQLKLGAASHITASNAFSDLDQATVEKEWRLSADSALYVQAGRTTTNWSPWHGNSVVLSGQFPGIDQLQYTYRQGAASFDKLVGRLESDNRYLLAHRFTLQVGQLTGSVGETVVASGKFADNLATVLPWPFYWTQWAGLKSGGSSSYLSNDEVNINVFVQGLYTGKNGLMLGGELLVDDMPQWWGEQQLFQMAGQVRAELPVGGAGRLAVQYARVNNFTYAFQVPFGDYSHRGFSLGSPYGPDNDELLLTYDFPRTWFGLTGIGYSIRRKGEGEFGDTWESDGYDATKDKQFLAGVVEQTQLWFAKAAYPIGDSGELNVRFGAGPIRNAKNVAGYDKIHPEGSVELRYRFGD